MIGLRDRGLFFQLQGRAKRSILEPTKTLGPEAMKTHAFVAPQRFDHAVQLPLFFTNHKAGTGLNP